jgi:hypothetical protein
MIVYDNRCTPCARKQQWRELRNFARLHKLPLQRFDISKDINARERAAQYDVDVPFVVHDKTALKLGEPWERLL